MLKLARVLSGRPAGGPDRLRLAADALAKATEELREIGDALFALANAERLLKVNPEMALRRAIEKLTARFTALQKEFAVRGRELKNVPLDEMDAVGEEIKKR
jgi:tetrapyrrole methylase family protein / MazG family protein